MEKIKQLKSILQRKTKVDNSRYLTINIDEISREMGCSISDVKTLLNRLCFSKDIKALIPKGAANTYLLTVMEKSTIWTDWQL